jgi:hypothetical protein
MAERPRVCFDRFLPRDLMRDTPTVRREGRVRAVAPRGKTWINGSTLHVRFMGGTAAEQKVAREQAGWWSDVANLKFAFDDAPTADTRLRHDTFDGAWSYIGNDCRNIPLNEATMNLGFLDGGTAAHEFGHAIGLAHEHQSPAGGIQWNEQVVIREMAKSPNFWDEATTRHNILRRYTLEQVNGTNFDADSIMLYFFPDGWTLNGKGTHANEALSNLDKSFVAGAKMYPRGGAVADDAVALTVNATRRTQASIGKAGEVDLFRFKATRNGRYVIDTAGSTDVVMNLFGPDSQTALLAEDDDSGHGLNARIVANLVAGEYWVQVRHYDRRRASGNYSIKVRKL